jgi:hypothetical protein
VDRSSAGSSRQSLTNPELISSAAADSSGGNVEASASIGIADRGATASRGATRLRRLLADHRYFGLEPQAFHDGAARLLARVSTLAPERKRIDVQSLGEDFRLDAAASSALLQAMLANGLLRPHGSESYRPAAIFREFVLATPVAPLSRAHARELIDGVCKRAARINAQWARNPFRINMIAVSGSYMSRRDRLPELSLWLVLRRRPAARMRRWGRALSKNDALRQIAAAAKALSSFIVVRIVADRQEVERPFSVVFQADEDAFDSSAPAWQRFREWGFSISRRFSLR